MLNNYSMVEGSALYIKHLKSLLNQSYKSKKNDDPEIDNKFKLDNDLSTDKTKVYTTDDNQIVIANRGTSDFRDVISDIKLAFGFKDKRFKEAKEVLEKVKSKYQGIPITTIGHSLGARVAEELGDDEQIKEVITLNKPTTPLDLFKKNKKTDKQYDIRTKKDLVSILAPFQPDNKDINIPSETNDLYKEHKIDVLDRLNQELKVGKGLRRIKKADIKKLIKYVLKMKKNKTKYHNYDLDLLMSLLND